MKYQHSATKSVEVGLVTAGLAAAALTYLVGSLAEQWRVRRKRKGDTWSFLDRHEGKVPSLARIATLIALAVASPIIWSWYVPRVPTLTVASSLEIHEEPRRFRIVVESDTEAAISITVEKLVGGTQKHDDEMPIGLGMVLLHAHRPLRIPLVTVSREVLIVGTRHVTIADQQGNIIPAEFCIRMTMIGSSVVVDRRFKLIPAPADDRIRYRPEFAGQSCS